MAGIYVHLPFCPYICPYCDFAKWPHKASAARRYMDALLREIALFERERASAHAPYDTVFLGGGTPNTYPAADIAALLATLDRFSGAPGRETTIEVNPELVTVDAARAYADAGINRFSIGVQSFVPHEIATLGRRHDPQQIAQAVHAAREAGIRSVSIDLIFGTPGQTLESWRTSLETAIDLGVDHISTYGLTVESGTPYERWQQRDPSAFPGDSFEADLYDLAIRTLESSGFEQYEISNFARPGHASAHNRNYWANGEYAGFGVGAASYLNGVRAVHTRSLDEYTGAALSGTPIPGESEELQGAQRAGEAIMLALRTAQGVSFAQFKERYGLDFLRDYAAVVRQYCDDGLLEVDATHARLTRSGRFVANDVCAAFVTSG